MFLTIVREGNVIKFPSTSEEFGLTPLTHDSNMGNSFFQNSEIYFKMSVSLCFMLLLLTPRQIFLGKNITVKQNTTRNCH